MVVSSTLCSESSYFSLEEGFADLTTDRDYNHVANRVNANRFRLPVVTSCHVRVFCNLPKFVIRASNLSRGELIADSLPSPQSARLLTLCYFIHIDGFW
jgi:hypothetical protein